MNHTNLLRALILIFLCAHFQSCGSVKPSSRATAKEKNDSDLNGTEQNNSEANQNDSELNQNDSDKTTTDTSTQCSTGLSLQDDITYEKDIKPMFTAKCTWCHSETALTKNRKRPYLTTYSQMVKEAGESYQEMNKGEMPPNNKEPQLESGDLAMYKSWIDNGFVEGEPPAEIDLSNAVGYNPVIKDLLDRKCIGCHKPGATSPDLTTYEAAKSAAALSLSDLQAGSMPPGAGVAPQDEIAAFKQWVDNDFPEEGGELPPGTADSDPCP